MKKNILTHALFFVFALNISFAQQGSTSKAGFIETNYEINLPPGKTFQGSYYFWNQDVGALTYNPALVEPVEWIDSLTINQNVSNSCEDFIHVRIFIQAPEEEGIYTAFLQDLNGNYAGVNILLTVTSNLPYTDSLTITTNVNTLISQPEPFVNSGLPGLGCTEFAFSNEPFEFNFSLFPEVSFITISPENFSLLTGQNNFVIYSGQTDIAGTYVFYRIITSDYFSFPGIVKITLIVEDPLLGNFPKSNDFQPYPNPAQEQITLPLGDFNKTAVHGKVYSLTGQYLMNLEGFVNGDAFICDLTKLRTGAYIIRILNNDGSFQNFRILKQ
jgi:hypothetical protein